MNKEEIRLELIKIYSRIDKNPKDVIDICKKYESYIYEPEEETEKKIVKKSSKVDKLFT